MKLTEIVLKNFRAYRGEHRIPVSNLTAFVGKNDSGKSSIFDALAIFFEHPLGKKYDFSDVCVNWDTSKLKVADNLVIGAMKGLPNEDT